MAFIDMPMEELQVYLGSSPRPNDFEEYWDRALAELEELPDRVELSPAPFKASFARCDDLFFTGVGGARVHAKLLRPIDTPPARSPALLQFHGYSMSSGDWSEKLGYVAAGFVVAALDCRGQGGLSEDAGSVRGNTLHGHIIRGAEDDPEKLLYRQIFLDTVQLARFVMNLEEVDAARVGVKGASQGGALSLACAALEPRIRKVVSIYPFLSDYRRAWELDPDHTAYLELKEYFRRFDPTHAREADLFMRLGYVDVQNLAHKIEGEVLMATGLSDDVCPPSTQFAAYNRITAAKQMEIYPDFGHEDLPGIEDTAFRFLADLIDPEWPDGAGGRCTDRRRV
ncbi:alpha/beta fold hydrolase [Salinispira pacifica]